MHYGKKPNHSVVLTSVPNFEELVPSEPRLQVTSMMALRLSLEISTSVP